MRRTLLPLAALAALAALAMFSGVAAADDSTILVPLIEGLIDSLTELLEMLPDAE